jgi:hypothetical protein
VSLEKRLQKIERQSETIWAARSNKGKVEQALQGASLATNAYDWVRFHTKTYNQHWKLEGRPSPYEPFPDKPYFKPIFDLLELERIVWIAKSRDLMVSWACVAFLTYKAMTIPECEILLQTQKEDKAIQLVDYAKCLHEHSDPLIKKAYGVFKPVSMQPKLELQFRGGGRVVGIPGGASQIRSYHPWGYLLDEASFVDEAGECYNEALAAAKGSIILNSSAGPGWYADARRDIVQAQEN